MSSFGRRALPSVILIALGLIVSGYLSVPAIKRLSSRRIAVTLALLGSGLPVRPSRCSPGDDAGTIPQGRF
jgi:hypothetical protein